MIILLVNLIFGYSWACRINEQVKNVYSFSGPVTLMLKNLDILKDPKLKGISHFHPISKEEFSGEVYPGGLFLSHETINKFKDGIIFFDESRELKKIVSSIKHLKAIEIYSRNLTPSEVNEHVIEKLKPIFEDCNFEKVKKDMEIKLLRLRALLKVRKTYLFFLGLIQNKKFPEILIVNDGIVKWMKNEKLISTYPSELAYVNWSFKIMRGLPADTQFIGIKDSGSTQEKKIFKKDKAINLTYPGALIPGEGQVEAMLYLFEKL